MEEQNTNEIAQKNAELEQAWTGKEANLKEKKNDKKKKTESSKKSWLIPLVIGIIGLIGGAICLVIGLTKTPEKTSSLVFPKIPSKGLEEKAIYSNLTGEVLENDTQKTAPAYCIQTPNGTDGARPQSGLTEAGVIFEAIAEAGITRFAAIYQDPSTAVIGPIRSLRIYYLDWDTPFDCTIVHAGGADDALKAVQSGGYKDLSENYEYMYRGTYKNRLWNNLFTTSDYLRKYSSEHGYTSDIKGFARMTPEESNKTRAEKIAVEVLDITKPTEKNTSETKPEASAITFRFGGIASFNVNYDYDAKSNTYLRSFENGTKHEVYKCENSNLGEKNPEDVCNLTQMSPSVVIAMMVNEGKAADGYHEAITTIGSGKAYIFQNGLAIEGTWNKASKGEQIKFTDKGGNEIELVPGQTIISAIPEYGGVAF